MGRAIQSQRSALLKWKVERKSAEQASSGKLVKSGYFHKEHSDLCNSLQARWSECSTKACF